jgi:ABC-type Zn uptake system ZnuABC Zn-binding protein ZnuA
VRALGVLVSLLLVSAIAAAGCADDSSGGGNELRAVATTSHVAELVRQVGGARVEVTGLLESGADPHGYEPRPSDVAAIGKADVVFRSGGEVDEWLDELLEGAGADADEVVSLVDAVTPIRAGDGEVDPHWWQDPRNAILAAGAIGRALAEADPERRSAYERSGAAYARELRALDRELAACFARVSEARRSLVTTHDSLAYLARRYGLDVVGSVIPSLSSQAQPSAADVQALVDQIEEQGVKAVFPEAGVSQKLQQAISRESGAAVGGRLWTDSLGPDGSGAETYMGAMRANADVLVRGMSGGSERCR